MISRWLPFVFGIAIESIIGVASYLTLLSMRMVGLTESVDFSQCTPNGLEQYDQPLVQCVSNTSLNFLNHPEFLIQLFVVIMVLIASISFLLNMWSTKKETPLFITVGVFAALSMSAMIDRSYIGAIALLAGHLLGCLAHYYWFKQKRISTS